MYSKESIPLNLRFLLAFCGDRERCLDLPFSRGQWSYATDARIAIRIPRQPFIPEDPLTAEGIEKLPFIENGSLPTEYIDIPELPARRFEPCPECREMSGGKPSRNCSECGGLGRVDARIPVALLGRAFDAYYLREMKIFLQGVKIAREPSETGPLRFEFRLPGEVLNRGGRGLLMPLRGED